MHEKTRLGQMILEHWKTHRPKMVADLERSHKLTKAVQEAEERASDLLYEFLSVRKMDYQQAWELAMREVLLPEETSPKTSRSKSSPATSE